MDAQIQLAGGTDDDLAALADWLPGEDELRGRVRAETRPPGDTDLGSVAELLTVALGSGGAGSVLASSLKTWLLTRRTTAKIIARTPKRSVTLDLENAGDIGPLLDQIRQSGDDG